MLHIRYILKLKNSKALGVKMSYERKEHDDDDGK